MDGLGDALQALIMALVIICLIGGFVMGFITAALLLEVF